MTRFLIFLSLMFWLGACASADITIQADLYSKVTAADRERSAAREQRQQLSAVHDIARTRGIAASCGEKVKLLASDLVEVTVAYQGLHASLSKRQFNIAAARAPFLQRRPMFDRAVDVAVLQVGESADQAQAALADVLFADFLAASTDPAFSDEQQELNLVNATATFANTVSELNSAMEAVVNVLGAGTTPYAIALKTTVQVLSDGLAKIRSGDVGALDIPSEIQKEQSEGLAEKVAALARSSNDISQECATLPPSFVENLSGAATELSSDTRVGIQESLPAVVVGLQTMTGPLKLGPGARADIRDLAINQTFYLSQIDRLQDPADPAWREVLDPENDKNWGTLFARTKFRAEGKSDVIVVRDRPGHYRVQRGVNNPAALIQGQLEISRSVASAATAVLGAISGVNVPLISDKADSTPGPVATVKGADDSSTLRGEVARVDEAQRVRNAARTAMAADLQTAIRDLLALVDPEGSAADTARRNEVYARMVPVLNAYAELLKFTGEVK